MSEHYMIVGTSNTNDGPRRVVQIEETLKGGVCRACWQCLSVGEPRIKVSYPNVIVHYAARTGMPSFFIHPECFSTCPVDFVRMGSTAYKETVSVSHYVMNPQCDVVGWNKFPKVQPYFSNCQVPMQLSSLQAGVSTMPSTAVLAASPCHATPSSNSEPALQKSSASLVYDAGACEDVSFTTVAPRSRLPQPCGTEADFDAITSALKLPCEEDQQLYANPGLRSSVKPTSLLHCQPCMELCTCPCRSESSFETMQWVTPREAAKTLGIAPSFLRSMALDRVIPVLRRPRGQRLYNVRSVRKFLNDHIVHPVNVSLKNQRLL